MNKRIAFIAFAFLKSQLSAAQNAPEVPPSGPVQISSPTAKESADIARLIARLGDAQYPRREKAHAELEKYRDRYGAQILPDLARWANDPDLEIRRHLSHLAEPLAKELIETSLLRKAQQIRQAKDKSTDQIRRELDALMSETDRLYSNPQALEALIAPWEQLKSLMPEIASQEIENQIAQLKDGDRLRGYLLFDFASWLSGTNQAGEAKNALYKAMIRYPKITLDQDFLRSVGFAGALGDEKFVTAFVRYGGYPQAVDEAMGQ